MDREESAQRIERDIETLSGSDYTLTDEAIRRYAYTQEYRNTIASPDTDGTKLVLPTT